MTQDIPKNTTTIYKRTKDNKGFIAVEVGRGMTRGSKGQYVGGVHVEREGGKWVVVEKSFDWGMAGTVAVIVLLGIGFALAVWVGG